MMVSNRVTGKTSRVLCLLLGLAVLSAVSLPVRADDTTVFRIRTGFLYPLDNVWKMGFSEELYYTEDGELYSHETDLGLEYSGLADWLSLGGYFKYVEANGNGQDWKREYRPHFNVTVKGKLWDLGWSNRVRIEYRDLETKDQWRLRNKLMLDMPFVIPVLNARPYVGDEQFWNLSENGFNQNRLYTGLKFTLFKHLKTDLYYYWGKTQLPGRWDEQSFLGTNMIWNF